MFTSSIPFKFIVVVSFALGQNQSPMVVGLQWESMSVVAKVWKTGTIIRGLDG
jgi:hypothetical protein